MGHYKFTVGDLIQMLQDEPQDALVLPMYDDKDGSHNARPIYKTACAADDSVVYLYLSDTLEDM